MDRMDDLLFGCPCAEKVSDLITHGFKVSPNLAYTFLTAYLTMPRNNRVDLHPNYMVQQFYPGAELAVCGEGKLPSHNVVTGKENLVLGVVNHDRRR